MLTIEEVRSNCTMKHAGRVASESSSIMTRIVFFFRVERQISASTSQQQTSRLFHFFLFSFFTPTERAPPATCVMFFQWRVAVLRAPRFAFSTSHFARALLQARRRACTVVAEADQPRPIPETNPHNSKFSSCKANNSTISRSKETQQPFKKQRPLLTQDSVSTARKVQICSTPFHHLAPRQRVHLVQLERLLQRHVPHARKSAFHAHQPASGNSCNVIDQASCEPLSTNVACKVTSSVAHSELFVMSRVLVRSVSSTSSSPSASTLLTLNSRGTEQQPCVRDAGNEHDEVFTGVNHAFHKHVNPHGAILRGILKGCAEQNALGAAAAGGCAYADVTDVFVLAVRTGESGNDESLHAKPTFDSLKACNNSCESTRAAAIFPCPECWRHLCHVARVRYEHTLPPLRLFVCAASSSTAVHLLALAQQRVSVMEEPMHVCIVTR